MRIFSNFRRHQGGNAAIMFSFAMLPTVLAGGAAVDYSRATAVRAELQAGVDSAALGVARDGATMSDSEIQTHGRRFFDANFQIGRDITMAPFRWSGRARPSP